MIMTTAVKIGDRILISPDLTGQKQWIEGTVISIENNSFVGQVITARSAIDGDIYFGRDYSFKKESELCLQ
jgi:hypothetical protein